MSRNGGAEEMKTDLYTKVILTLIGVLLAIITLRPVLQTER
jgi:hypothetical protein